MQTLRVVVLCSALFTCCEAVLAADECSDVLANVDQFSTIFSEQSWSFPFLTVSERPLCDPAKNPWWTDFSAMPKKLAAEFSNASMVSDGIKRLPLMLSLNVETREVLIQTGSGETVLSVAAPKDYDAAAKYTSLLNAWHPFFCGGDDVDSCRKALHPERLVLHVWLADLNDMASYEKLLAEQEAAAKAALEALSSGDSGGGAEALTTDCSATNVFQVIAITPTVEERVTVRWNSECNAIYRIEYAPELSTNTTWEVMYEDYPSHGTTTFWADAGKWLAEPEIKRPGRELKRFYRIVKTGTNVAPPQVTIIFPTNGVVLSGDVTVSMTATGASTIASIKLFVDGEEFDSISGEQTNLIINTGEWANGPHTLFAVAEDATGIETTPSTNALGAQIAASPYVTAVFSNYVSRFWFSEDFFEPELGETQHISAVFPTNSNWTLTILDSSSNAVRTVTGTGTTMNFAWDGTGDGNSPLPNGLYDFAVSATATDSLLLATSGTLGTTRRIPRRVKGKAGTFGIAYQGHHPTNDATTTGFTAPSNLPSGSITLDPNYALPYGRIKRAQEIAEKFAAAMGTGGWKTQSPFPLGNDKLLASHLRKPSKGGSSVFNQVNIGLLVGHGIRGSNGDGTIALNKPLQTYMPIYKTGASNYDWVRLSECDFGSSNLRWMAIFACNILHDENYQDMWDKGVLPINEQLHLLLSAETFVFMYPEFGKKWAQAMLGKEPGGIRTVKEAWYFAGEETQKLSNPTGPVVFRVAGWHACFTDKLLDYSDPDTENAIERDYKQVYPAQ
jgi:Family of unknown function (DUF6345)/Bacterial Ig domain/FlgD Ig-like domain